ncbi:DUF167 domain-containing protein [Qipengyuania sp.]|uniref:DUF167 domain-containing protein n=1 Tax=Qipengyuania sp. TaxID=2004515 RepID=UPI0035C7D338
MARPRADLPEPSALRALIRDGSLRVRVTPGARVECVTLEEGRVQIKVRAKPQDGAANKAVCLLVARALGEAGSRVRLLRGATSRDKVLQIDA